LSAMFAKYKWRISNWKKWFLPYIWFIWAVVLLIAMQPDFGSILVILPVATILFFVAGWNVRHLFVMWTLWLFLLVSVYFMGKYDPDKLVTQEDRPAFAYIYDRINSFLWQEEDEKKSGNVLYQQDQWLIAIWTGWWMWVWFGSSVQKYWYVPQVEWDFIFSVIVEELWFLWALWLIWIYLFIWFRCFVLASNSKDDFAKYFAIWIWSRILMQAFVNLWVNLKILPNTWITLPFVSYWGSSLMSLAIGVALLLWISRDIDKDYVSSTKKRGTKWAFSSVNMIAK
jgi:cell division protein FtsW